MKTPEDLKQRASGWAQKLILLLEAETGYSYEAGDTAMLADFIAQIQRETAEECCGCGR